MIYNRIFDIKYIYYDHASAAYWGLQLPTVKVFIPSNEQVTIAKKFIIHRLVLDLNHLDRVCKDLRSKKLSRFFKIDLISAMVSYFFVIYSVRMNFASSWNKWLNFWKFVK